MRRSFATNMLTIQICFPFPAFRNLLDSKTRTHSVRHRVTDAHQIGGGASQEPHEVIGDTAVFSLSHKCAPCSRSVFCVPCVPKYVRQQLYINSRWQRVTATQRDQSYATSMLGVPTLNLLCSPPSEIFSTAKCPSARWRRPTTTWRRS